MFINISISLFNIYIYFDLCFLQLLKPTLAPFNGAAVPSRDATAGVEGGDLRSAQVVHDPMERTVYLPTFTTYKSTIHVGKYASPMDPI